MKIDIEFKGLEELVKAFESAASDEDIAQVNKAIAEKGEPVVQRIMSGKIPKSKDIKKSGRGFGSKSSVSAHAADEIIIIAAQSTILFSSPVFGTSSEPVADITSVTVYPHT